MSKSLTESSLVESFIKTVQEQIEWKRAREPATLEIREYMLDRVEQLMTDKAKESLPEQKIG